MSSNPSTNTITGIADTGASGHYIRPTDPHHTNGAIKAPILVGLPNGDCLQSTNKECTLALMQLPTTARTAHIIPGLTHSSLISIGTLCDAGCTATFDSTHVKITKNDMTLLTGIREHRTGLWRLPLVDPPTLHINDHNKITEAPTHKLHQLNSVYSTTTIAALVKFLHAAAFSPVVSTWIKAIKNGFFQSWPGLTATAVHKHFPHSVASTKGHMDQTRKNIRSKFLDEDCIRCQRFLEFGSECLVDGR